MKLVTSLTFIALFGGCESKDRLLTVEPSMKNVAGHYKLAYVGFNSTIDSEIKSKIPKSHIELKDDGTMVLTNFPVVTKNDNHIFSVQRYHTGSTSYKISPLGATSGNMFYGIYVNHGDLPDPLHAPCFRSEGESLTLSFEYFDGDFVPRMTFTRTEPEQ